MDLIFGLAVVIGIGPALILIYLGVRNYTYPRVEQPFFSDPTFFMLLVVGMIAGLVLFFAFYIMVFASNVVYMAILAIIETLVMVVVMNLRRFRGKSDSVFYGYALGLGISCGLATGIVFLVSGVISDAGGSILDPSILVFILLSVSMSLMLGSCGTTVGEGIARHRVMEFTHRAMIPLIIYNILMTVVIRGINDEGSVIIYYICVTATLVLSAGMYYRTICLRLPQIMREILKMEGKKRDNIPRSR